MCRFCKYFILKSYLWRTSILLRLTWRSCVNLKQKRTAARTRLTPRRAAELLGFGPRTQSLNERSRAAHMFAPLSPARPGLRQLCSDLPELYVVALVTDYGTGCTACASAHVVSTSALMMLCRECPRTSRFNVQDRLGAARGLTRGTSAFALRTGQTGNLLSVKGWFSPLHSTETYFLFNSVVNYFSVEVKKPALAY